MTKNLFIELTEGIGITEKDIQKWITPFRKAGFYINYRGHDGEKFTAWQLQEPKENEK